MLVRRGVGAVANPVFGDTVPVGAPSPSMSSSWDRPWQCQWVPGYSWANPSVCQNYPKPPAPVAPVIPSGALDPKQNPAGPAGGGYYSVDQIVGDTAAAQRGQARSFFADVAGSLGLQDPEDAAACDPDAFWCNYKNLVLLGGLAFGALIVVNLVKGATR